jgi:hypothetical protein
MKLIYFVLSFGFGLFSCNKENKNANDLVIDGILSKEETISILDELILIETHLQSKYYSFSNYGEALALSRDSILKSKNTNIRQFNKSFNHYAKTDKELIDIYENVLNNYNEKSAKAIIIQK